MRKEWTFQDGSSLWFKKSGQPRCLTLSSLGTRTLRRRWFNSYSSLIVLLTSSYLFSNTRHPSCSPLLIPTTTKPLFLSQTHAPSCPLPVSNTHPTTSFHQYHNPLPSRPSYPSILIFIFFIPTKPVHCPQHYILSHGISNVKEEPQVHTCAATVLRKRPLRHRL